MDRKEISGMSSVEISGGVLDSLESKLERYYGKSVNSVVPSAKYGSYDEAKKAGDVQEMLGCKLSEMRARSNNMDVISLSNKYSSSLSIIDIQKRIPSAENTMEKARDIMDRIYNAELDKVTKQYQKGIGGLQQEELARAKAMEAVDEWADADNEYQKAREEYLEAKRDYTALRNAKDIFIEDNMELIEAERCRAKREELLSSGILEEFGITPSEG